MGKVVKFNQAQQIGHDVAEPISPIRDYLIKGNLVRVDSLMGVRNLPAEYNITGDIMRKYGWKNKFPFFLIVDNDKEVVSSISEKQLTSIVNSNCHSEKVPPANFVAYLMKFFGKNRQDAMSIDQEDFIREQQAKRSLARRGRKLTW